MANSEQTAQRRPMNTPLHSSHGGKRGRSVDGKLVRVLQTQSTKLRRAARLALHNPTRRALLKTLVTHPNGVTYRDLIGYLPVSERWTRELVADLRTEGIVETPGNPALIQFTSREVVVAVREVLSFLSADWVDVVTDGAKTALRSLPTDSDSTPHLENYLKTMSGILRGRGKGGGPR